MSFNLMRGYAYPRNMSVWVGYTDPRTGVQIQRAITPAIKLDAPIRKRNGNWQWPLDVRAKISDFFRRLERGEIEDTVKSPTISEALEHYLNLYRKRPRTATVVHGAVRQFVRCMGDMRMNDITEEIISEWTTKLNAGGFTKTFTTKVPVSGDRPKNSRLRFRSEKKEISVPYRQNSINNFHRSLHPIFKLAVRKGWMDRNPFDDPMIRERPAALSIVTFNHQQIEEILKRAASIRQNDRFHPEFDDAFRFMLMTGFRVSEVIALQWADIDFEKQHIRVLSKDEGRWDYFPMPEGSKLNAFMRSLDRAHAPKVFRWDGTRFLSRVMTRILRDMELKTPKGTQDDSGYHLHSLRKTFISNLVQNGATPEVTKRMARHRSYTTTEKYYIAFGMESLLPGVQLFDQSKLAALL